MGNAIYNTDDTIDYCDIIERIAELVSEWEDSTGDDAGDYSMSEDDWAVGLGEDDARELVALQELARQGENYASDWSYGATFIHTDYFTEYTKELLADTGCLPADMPDWIVIDWEETADNVKVDYTELDFDGQTYYVR